MNIFIAFSYADERDKEVRDKLLRQLNLVKDKEGWNIWSSQKIPPGSNWDEEIKGRLKSSEIAILLLSPDFFDSDYIRDVELPEIIERYLKGECHIIPIIARICYWRDTKLGEYVELGSIQALPADEKPVISKVWDNDDQPYFECVKGIRWAIREFQRKRADEKARIEHGIQEAEAARLKEEQRLRAEAVARKQEAYKTRKEWRQNRRKQREDEELRKQKEYQNAQKSERSKEENITDVPISFIPERSKEENITDVATPFIIGRKDEKPSRISKDLSILINVVFTVIILSAGYKTCEYVRRQTIQDTNKGISILPKSNSVVDSSTLSNKYPNGDSAARTSTNTKPIVLQKRTETTSTKPPPANEPSTITTPKATTKDGSTVQGVGSGRWEVRAGTYQYAEGARDRLEQVISMGYTNAEIKKTSNGWFAIIVLRTNNKDKAIEVADQLEKRGVDTGVFKR